MQNSIQLHDIKPLVEVQEYSLYYFLALVAIALVIVLGALYLGIKWFKHRNRFSLRKEHYKKLNEIDFKDPKKSAYALTHYGATFKDDSQRHTEMYANLLERLEPYKYKKDVPPLEDEVISYIELYRGMIDV